MTTTSAMLDIPPDLLPLQDLLAESLARVEQVFNEAIDSDLPPVRALCAHIERYRGKMLRPALVILSGLAAAPPLPNAGQSAERGTQSADVADPADVVDPPAGGDPDHPARSALHSSLSTLHSSLFTIAAVCEMIHMATLVHDDVLDDADTRRGGRTVNGLQGNEAAVILGDYLFSSAYRLCATLPSQTPALLIGQTGMMLCAGELLQLAHRGDLSLDQPTYYEIVGRKTASLIAVSCRLGALTGGASEETAAAFADFGRLLGIAFQIQDDLLDLLGNQATVGKPLGRDAELGKLTLPIIHHLGVASADERGRTLLLLDATGGNGRSTHAAAGSKERLVAALEATGSINHAREAARDLVDEAKRALNGEGGQVGDTPAKRFLLTMADAVVNRAF